MAIQWPFKRVVTLNVLTTLAVNKGRKGEIPSWGKNLLIEGWPIFEESPAWITEITRF
jgi:hypothetical protein